MGLFLTLLALVGIIAIMVWIVQLPFLALLINIGLIALAAWIVQGPFVALLAIIDFCRRHRIGFAVGHRGRHPTPSHHYAGCWYGAGRS
jgi:hypothetical protein